MPPYRLSFRPSLPQETYRYAAKSRPVLVHAPPIQCLGYLAWVAVPGRARALSEEGGERYSPGASGSGTGTGRPRDRSSAGGRRRRSHRVRIGGQAKRSPGGAFFDLGAHVIDWVLGSADTGTGPVTGFFRKRVWHDRTDEDQVQGIIHFAGGKLADVQQSHISRRACTDTARRERRYRSPLHRHDA